MIEPEASERASSTDADSAPLMAAYRSTITLSDLTRVVAAAQEIQRLFNNETPWWRGHAKAGWRLEAQVHRQNLEHPEPRPYDEPSLIGHFVSRAPSRSHRLCPDADDYFGWLFLAQHYGLPTRLLDWTENPLVAAYFAVQDLDDDGCVWALSPTGLNRGATHGLIKIRDPKAIEFAKSAFTGQRLPDIVLAIDGQEIDARMLAQMSRFTLHSYPGALEQKPESANWLRQFVIPKNAKPVIRAQLSALGIRRSNLFPDLASLATELKSSSFG